MSWMERSKALLEEEGMPGAATEDELEARTTVEEGRPEPVDETALPSWLQEIRPPLETLEEEAEGLAEEPAVPIAEEDLPAWLRELKPEGALPPTSAPEDREPGLDQAADWLEEEEAAMVSGEEPASLEEGLPAEAEAPSWLLELREEALEEAGLSPTDREEEPSWLRELREEAIEEEPALSAEGWGGSREEAARRHAGEEMPAGVLDVQAESTEIPTPQEEEPETPTVVEPGAHIVEAELPSWLRELRAEMAEEGEIPPLEEELAAVEEQPTQPTEEEVPSWLAQLGAEEQLAEALQPEAPGTPVEEAEAYGPDEEEVPSWLRELRAQAEEGETGPLMQEAEEIAQEMGLPPVEEEELPPWLRELKAEAAKEGVGAAPTPSEELVEQISEEEALPVEAEVGPVAQQIVPPAVPEDEAVVPAAAAELEEEGVSLGEEEPRPMAPQPGWGVQEYREYLERSPRDLDARLALARIYVESGRLDHAVEEYGELLSYGSMAQQVLEDLESAVASAPDHLATHELLADAYMRAGELKKALDKYRWLRAMMTQ